MNSMTGCLMSSSQTTLYVYSVVPKIVCVRLLSAKAAPSAASNVKRRYVANVAQA